MIPMEPKIYEKGPKNYEVGEEEIEVPLQLAKKLHFSKNQFHLNNDEEDK